MTEKQVGSVNGGRTRLGKQDDLVPDTEFKN